MEEKMVRYQTRLKDRTPDQIAEDCRRLRPFNTKRCPRCKESKPIDSFAHSRAKPDGLQDYCRVCKIGPHHKHGKDFGVSCVYCGGPFEQVDHVLSSQFNGTDDLNNLVASCKQCNLYKADRHPLDWLAAMKLDPIVWCAANGIDSTSWPVL